MVLTNSGSTYLTHKWVGRVVFLSLLLLFFTIPHTLEDFATGEPAEAGVPAPLLSLVVSTIIFVQAIGLFWLGKKHRWGLYAHIAIGLFWPIASGFAQLPTIFNGELYRSGAISIGYVAGMIVIGILLCLSSIMALAKREI
ncbi:MAG: hypothetical protein ACI9EW_000173 [Cellvibrionaceae bacterium]|jgi:hypothetical protein